MNILANNSQLKLDLRSENRKIIYKGSLKKKASGSAESADVQVYLLDHCLIIGKPKFLNGKERYKLYRKVAMEEKIATTSSH